MTSLLPNPVRWIDYDKNFGALYSVFLPKLLENGAVECNGGPTLGPRQPLRYPRQAPFQMEWAIIYPDHKYFRVKECFNRLGRPNQGAGYREHFSFHYGTAHPELDTDGYPKMGISDNPPLADLRIDRDRWPPHIHAGSPEHIYQDRVQGLDIQNADLVGFLEAVLAHRKTGESLMTLLQITVLR